jgi:hypothetical protein
VLQEKSPSSQNAKLQSEEEHIHFDGVVELRVESVIDGLGLKVVGTCCDFAECSQCSKG